MKSYDFVFITNLPAFYKVNLFNKLSEFCKIKVIFISKTSIIRDEDFFNYHHDFDSEYISSVDFECRSKLNSLIRVFKAIHGIDYKYLVFSGWEIKELFPLPFIRKKKKNAIVIESSINETVTQGYAWLLKKVYLKRMGTAFPSGILQKAILEKINYKGNIIITHGVGIPNFDKIPLSQTGINESKKALKYVYVGRLSAEKNLQLAIRAFEGREEILRIVGTGPEEIKLKGISGKNIDFLGYVNNKALGDIYQKADVFILPSSSEPWGLVVDEALSFSLPVIVSNRVGCKDDLVVNDNGLVFEYNSVDSLKRCMDDMKNKYHYYKNNAIRTDMQLTYEKQISSYLTSIK